MRDICWAACNNLPPGFTHPFGIYLCVVDIDCATGETRARRSCALDDRGTRMSPMIMAVQIRGGLTEGFEVAMGRQMPFEAEGNLLGNTPMDCVLPPFVEAPKWETDHTVTPSLHRPIGALRPSRP
jgi:carbon-monoxide dehydrogenase large subunit